MSEQKQEKVYVNGLFVKTQKTNFGDIIKLSIKAEDVVKFLNDNQQNGWVSIDLLQKREADDKGRTHTAVLNNWTPNTGGSSKPTYAPKVESDLPF